jgi:hypothetical protein
VMDGRKCFLHVSMDLLWLVTGDDELGKKVAGRLLEALEPTYGHRPEVLYGNSAPLWAQSEWPLFQRLCDYEGYICP